MAPLLGELTFSQWNADYRVMRDISTRRDHGTSTSDRVHRASVFRVLCGASTGCVRCASASGRMHRASACRVIRDTSTRWDHGTSTTVQVIRTTASCVLRGVSTCCVRCARASGRVHRAASTAPVVESTVMFFTLPLT